MADQLQLRGGTTAQTAGFTGALREVTVDTDKDTLVVHDGALAGGYPLLRQDLSNLPAGTIDNADINASAAIVDTKLATIATAGKVSNSATTAASANTASAIVARDASGNFTAGTITGALTGAASSNVLKAGDTMTGALGVTAGTAAAPSLFISGDTNTGLFSGGADQVSIATGGTQRAIVNASGNVGVNSASPNLTGFSGKTVTLDVGTGANGGYEIGKAGNLVAVFGVEAGTNDVRFGTTSSAALGLWANNQERARIDSSGRLGVGTSSPSQNLHVSSSGDTVIKVDSSAGAYSTRLSLSSGGIGGAVVENTSAGPLLFQINTSERMRIASTGNVLIGSPTTVDSRLSVLSASAINVACIKNSRNANGDSALTCQMGSSTNNTSSYFAIFQEEGVANRCIIYGNGNIQNINNSYGSLSDIKLKENIVDTGSQWADLKALQVRKYNFKEETGHQTHTQIGLVAQEVELVSPGLVSESPDRDAEGNDLGTVTKSVNYSVLYMKAVKALQEAMERIETLEAKVAALEAK
jgi:hypothetical protein